MGWLDNYYDPNDVQRDEFFDIPQITGAEPEFVVQEETALQSVQQDLELAQIVDETETAIRNFCATHPPRQDKTEEYGEISITVPLLYKTPLTLLDAIMEGGTAYKVKNGKIYIFWKPIQGITGAGYYELIGYTFIGVEFHTVTYFLNLRSKL